METFFEIYYRNVCTVQKKAIPLHRNSEEMLKFD